MPNMLRDLCSQNILSVKGNLLMYLLPDWLTKKNMLHYHILLYIWHISKDIQQIYSHCISIPVCGVCRNTDSVEVKLKF